MSYISNRQKYSRPQAMLWSEDYEAPATDSDPLIPPGYEIGSDADPEDQSFLILSDHNRSPIEIQSERLQQRQRMINGRMRSFHIADKKKISVSWDMLPSRRYIDDPNFRTVYSSGIFSATGNGQTITYVTTGPITMVVGEYVTIAGIDLSGFNFSKARVESTSVDPENNRTTFVVVGTATGDPVLTNASVTVYGAKPDFFAEDSFTVDNGAGGADLLDWYDTHTDPFYVYLAYDIPQNFVENKYERITEYAEVIQMYISDFSYSIVKRGAGNHDYYNVSVTLEEV